MKPILSVILPCRNEFPNLVHTMYSILHCLEAEGWDMNTVELIAVNNCSNDSKFPQRGTGGTTDYLMGRGAYYNRVIRVIYDPIAGNHSARNKGAEIARGEYLFFSDAHMSYRPGFFKSILQTVKTYGGLVHGALQFSGAYPPTDNSMGFQYTLKLGDECKMTWANYKLASTPWYIIGQGAWGMACRRDEFFRLGGYEDPHRTYGGEFYISLKAWMLGSSVMVDPNAVGYHLAAGRGYGYDHNDYKENILGLLYALGADEWRERAYLNYLRKADQKTMDAIMARGEKEYHADRERIAKEKIFTFNQLLTERPWEKKNIALHGSSNCSMTFFHWSWLEMILDAPLVQAAYRTAKYQQQLGEFIEKDLKNYIYRGDAYEKKFGMEKLLKWRKGEFGV